MATKDNVDWLLHIDTDELMYPGGNSGFSLQNVLSAFADEVDTVVFPNYESLPETDRVHDPFTEVPRRSCGILCVSRFLWLCMCPCVTTLLACSHLCKDCCGCPPDTYPTR